MKPLIININKEFRPFREGYDCDFITFPSGLEYHMNGLEIPPADEYLITAKMINSGSIFKLLILTNILKDRFPSSTIDVFIPYFPYARQDRVVTEGDPLSIKVFTDIINNQGYRKVFIFDPHSDVCKALLNGVVVISNYDFVNKCLPPGNNYYLVCPDLGASRKLYETAKNIGYSGKIIQALKHRNIKTGQIEQTEILVDDLEGKDCYIIDDICSRGGTFIGLGAELKKRNSGKVHLIVSHYEGSAEEIMLKQHIDSVQTTDSLIDKGTNFVTVHKIESWISF